MQIDQARLNDAWSTLRDDPRAMVQGTMRVLEHIADAPDVEAALVCLRDWLAEKVTLDEVRVLIEKLRATPRGAGFNPQRPEPAALGEPATISALYALTSVQRIMTGRSGGVFDSAARSVGYAIDAMKASGITDSKSMAASLLRKPPST